MSITAVSSAAPTAFAQRVPEAVEGPGPDHDGDADNKGVSGVQGSSISPAVPQGMGSAVNTKA